MARLCNHSSKCLTKSGCTVCRSIQRWSNMPKIVCPSCQRWKQSYCRGLCRGCYSRPNAKHRNTPCIFRYCPICLNLFLQSKSKMCCSRQCAGRLRHALKRNGKLYVCDRCRLFRYIRCKRLCASCYVTARLLVAGIGACQRRQRDIFGIGV